MAPLGRSSAGWMPARIGRLSAGVGRRHPVTIRKASLMAGSMRRFLRSDSSCRRYVSDLSNVNPRYLGSEQKSTVLLFYFTFSSRLASLLLRWKAADIVFVVLSFSFQVWRYSASVVKSLLSAPSTACQSPSACMIAGRQYMHTFWRRCLAGQRCRC